MRKKAVPVGIEDFERIINEDYYYVDKTLLIEELLINRAPVTLFTRPRRFGKTLNMSMIKYFFDVKNKEENKKLFENLKISNSEYMSEQGKYPVIFISLKDLKEDTWEKCFENLKKTMYKIFNEYEFVREKLNIVEKREFDKIWEMRDGEESFKTSLLDLSNYLNKYYGEKVIILIDEYDAPIINAFDKGYYNEAINFFQTFYSSALKTNNSLKYGILTGITRIIKEGIFSGLNNLYVNTNVSGNTLLENMLNHAGESVYEDLKRFTDGESIEKYISDGTTIKSLLSNDNEIWQLLLYSGYLTKDRKQKEIDVTTEYTDVYNLRIPNKEIRKYFGNMFLNRFFGTEEEAEKGKYFKNSSEEYP